MVGSSFVADAATGLDAWINEGNQKLHGMLVEAMGEEYVSSSTSLTTVAGTATYALPSGFFKLYGVDLTYHGDTHALLPYMRSERAAYQQEELVLRGPPRYSLVGSNLKLQPTPQSVMTGTIYYAPEATVLSSGTDAVNYPNGWEKYVVLYAAIQALLKEESSVTGLRQELAEVEKEIERAKEARDYANPKTLVDMDLVDVYSPWTR
jgi:hypothetical protein